MFHRSKETQPVTSSVHPISSPVLYPGEALQSFLVYQNKWVEFVS